MKRAAFTVWKTITLGINKSPSEYRKALKAGGYHIGDYADQILNKVKVSETETQLNLVLMAVAELGLKTRATRQQIYARAIEHGLGRCPAEVGPALRLQYPDQPNEERLHIAVEPITVLGVNLMVFKHLRVFGVDHYNGRRWLHSGCGCPDGFWAAYDCWVFVAHCK